MSSYDFSLESKEFADIALVSSTHSRVVEEICRLAKNKTSPRGRSFHFVNAYTIALAQRDPRYAKLLKTATANFPDGRPLTWLKLASGHRLTQIRGPQLFEDVVDTGRKFGVRHYLLGSSEQTLEHLVNSLCRRYPGVDIVGRYSPPYRAMTAEEVIDQDEAIRESGAEIVWVGLGTPKQDWEVSRLATELTTMNVAVGAAFDFSAGTKRVAPGWMSRLGLEWLFRFASEPRRLWRRYIFGNGVFLWTAARYLARIHLKPGSN